MDNHSGVLELLKAEGLSSVRDQLGGSPEHWSVDEIGDGNVNLIFRVNGSKGRVLIKQAVPYLRCVGESWPLSTQRSFFEYTALQEHGKLAEAYVPEVYAYLPDTAVVLMEFLEPHIILRKGMMAGKIYPNFAKHISDYMAKTLFFTSDLYLSAAEKKNKMKPFCENTDLCKITEDLIFTDPYRASPQNRYTRPELDPIVSSFHSDSKLKLAITEMKGKFLSFTQALIHGDLHSGSIMVTDTETKVIDPEFAFYGPMGFDVGLLIGNLLMSYFSQEGQGGTKEYETWILDQIREIWIRFAAQFSGYWETHLKGDYLSPNLFGGPESRALIADFRKKYMTDLWNDSIRFAAAEMIRRTLGLAHVADLDSIAEPTCKATCEYRNLKMAYELLVNSTNTRDVESLLALAKRARTLKLNG